jgi:FkbM family methyltransferase
MELDAGKAGASVFDTPESLEINRALMQHLDSLELPLAGASVLEVGYGVGQAAPFFLERNCKVMCVDGRMENIEALKRRLPGVIAHVARVDADPLARFGRFDIVFCYGLLHHLEDPIAGLRNLASVCDGFLLLETVVSDYELPILRLVDEPANAANQALGGLGCRPTPAFVAMALTRAGFDFVYAPLTPPRHPDFQFDWIDNLDSSRNDHLLRCIFVASRQELKSSHLQLVLSAPSGQNTPAYFLPPAGAHVDRIWLDVGAHLGEKSFSAAEQDSSLRVYAFEPNLRIGAQRMGRLPNFVVLPLAVAEQDGSAEFHVNKCDAASSLLPFVPEGLDRWIGKEQLCVEQTITVPTIRLDTFLDQSGIQFVEFLKIDAQGADLAVVKSCGDRLRDIDRIELEVQVTPVPLYRDAASRQEVLKYLEDAGFELETSEFQSQGQEENLVFVRASNRDPSIVLAEARDLSFLRPLQLRPRWHFGADWDNPDPLFRRRRGLWSYCNRRQIELPLEFVWYMGLNLTLYLGNDISRALFVGGAIDPNEFVFLERLLRPGMVVVDAGANEGLYTLFAAQRVGDSGMVLAIEPSSRELDRLERNIERNSLRNVTVYPVALGEAGGAADMRIAAGEHSGQNTLGDFAYPDIGLLREEHVPVCTLDFLIAESRIARLDLLKIDVEGSETRLLRGAADSMRKFRPVLLVEVSDEALRKQSSGGEELLQLIRSFGYLLYLFDAGTGLPRFAHPGESGANMIAVPEEMPLPTAWCAPGSPQECRSQKLQALSGESALFGLDKYRVHNASHVSGSGPVSVLTPPERWAYAVGFPIREEARREVPPLRGVMVRMDVVVEAGKIGIGIVSGDLSTYLVAEVQYGSSQDDVICELMTFYLPANSILMVRNTGSHQPSKVIIRSIETFIVGQE